MAANEPKSGTVVEDKLLATRALQLGQTLTSDKDQAAAQTMLQVAMVRAVRFPRNEDEFFQKLMRVCDRYSFAEGANYTFPRGKKKIEDPDNPGRVKWVPNEISDGTINLAREMKRLWGNMHTGFEVVFEDDDSRKIRAFAWDLETNAMASTEAQFKKLIQRKIDGATQWVVPDERDLLELTNRNAAKAERNCIFAVMPSDYKDEAKARCKATVLKNTKDSDPEKLRKSIIVAFGEINVSVALLEQYLGHRLGDSSDEELASLRVMFRTIRDGNANFFDYLDARGRQEAEGSPKSAGSLNVDDLTASQDANRGHGNDGMATIAQAAGAALRGVGEGTLPPESDSKGGLLPLDAGAEGGSLPVKAEEGSLFGPPDGATATETGDVKAGRANGRAKVKASPAGSQASEPSIREKLDTRLATAYPDADDRAAKLAAIFARVFKDQPKERMTVGEMSETDVKVLYGEIVGGSVKL